MSVLTVATDSMLSSFDDDGLETNIWKATVRSEPLVPIPVPVPKPVSVLVEAL